MPSPRRRPIAQRAAGWPSIEAELAGDFDPARYHPIALYAYVHKALTALERGDERTARDLLMQARDLESRLGPIPPVLGDGERARCRAIAARLFDCAPRA